MPQALPSGGGGPSADDGPGALTAIARAGLEIDVVDFDVTSPPSSPSPGNAYLVGVGATGAWAGWDGDVAIYPASGTIWRRKTARVGMRALKVTHGLWRQWNGRIWATDAELGVARGGIVAAPGGAQGDAPIAHALCVVGTVVTNGDAVTLPPAVTGQKCLVANAGASSLAIFPSSGDAIDAGSIDASKSLATNKRCRFEAVDDTTWISLVGA